MRQTFRFAWTRCPLGTALLIPFLLFPLACTGNSSVQPVETAVTAPVKEAQSVPAGGTSLIGDKDLSRFTVMNNGQLEVVPVEGQPFKNALRLTSNAKVANPWDVQSVITMNAPVKKGDVCLLTFYARTIKGQAETGEARSQAVFERNSSPYSKSLESDFNVPKEWQRFDAPFVVQEDLPEGGAQVCFRMGYGVQSFELGGVTLTNYGNTVTLKDLPRTKASYPGMEADATWRKEANARIEKIRKGDLAVMVKDATGRPVPNATITVRMQKHAFAFGSAVAGDALFREGPDGEKYREFIAKHFNRVVMENDFKWPQWEQRPELALKSVKWMHEHGIDVRGHNLVWPGWTNLPNDLQSLKGDKEKLAKRIDDHITDEVTKTKGMLVDWDVVNEPFANHDLMDILGEDSFLHWFQLTRKLDPHARLFLNDYPPLTGAVTDNPHLNDFYKRLAYLKSKGVLDGLGFQCHFGGSAIAPKDLLSGLDRFGKIGVPIAITEFDINSNDEDFQTAYTRDFMTATFSHPAVDSILMWGFWAGQHWLPDAALVNQDWSVRPHGQAWIDLVFKDWWTNADGQTDEKGTYQTRGFYGDYEISVTANGKTKTVRTRLVKGSKPFVVTL